MSDRLRIGIVCLHTSPLLDPGEGDAGGMNVVVLAQSKALTAMGHEVDIFTRRSDTTTPDTVQVSESLRVHHLTAGPAESLAKSAIDQHIDEFAAALSREARRRVDAGEGFHVLHSHHWMSGVAALDLSAELGIPHVQSFHSIAALSASGANLFEGEPPESPARVPGEARVARESDLVVTVSRAEATTAIRRCGADPERVRVVLPGVDHAVFHPCNESRMRKRAEVGRPYVFVAARLQPLKGVDLAIRAIAEIPSDVRPVLVVAGASSQDFAHYESQLHAIVAENDMADDVRFIGAVGRSELAEWLHGAALTLVPSFSETYGLIALESQACCTPVVAMAAGGLTEAVRDQVTGILMGNREPSQWAARIEGLLRDPDRLSWMQTEACQHAASRTWQASAEELVGHYTALLDPEEWLPAGDGPLVFLHAHPDDETIHTGPLVRHLVTTGHAVHVVTATRGERGEVVPGPLSDLAGTPELEVHRSGELARAIEILGIDRQVFLGADTARAAGRTPRRYRDSGMRWISPRVAGPAEDLTEDALCAATIDEAAEDLVAHLEVVGARALFSYDAHGTYGHPDHVRCHEIARRAATLAGIPLVEVLSPPENVAAAAVRTGAAGGPTDHVVDLRLDGHELFMRRALAQYASQLTVTGDTITHSGGDSEPLRYRSRLRVG